MIGLDLQLCCTIEDSLSGFTPMVMWRRWLLDKWSRIKIVDREAVKNKSKEDAEQRQVMLKDGLQDEDNLWNKDTLEEEEKDTIGALNFEIVNSVSFSDLSIYTVKLHVSEHRKPEVKVAKM